MAASTMVHEYLKHETWRGPHDVLLNKKSRLQGRRAEDPAFMNRPNKGALYNLSSTSSPFSSVISFPTSFPITHSAPSERAHYQTPPGPRAFALTLSLRPLPQRSSWLSLTCPLGLHTQVSFSGNSTLISSFKITKEEGLFLLYFSPWNLSLPNTL